MLCILLKPISVKVSKCELIVELEEKHREKALMQLL